MQIGLTCCRLLTGGFLRVLPYTAYPTTRMRHRVIRICSLTHQLLEYGRSLQLQEQLVQQRKAGQIGDTLLVIQHSPVFTVGKRGNSRDFLTNRQELSQLGFDVVHIPRGGETTYHGPGQLVAYPILNLRELGLGPRAYVEGLEQVMVQTAGCYGVQARGRVPGKTGVWVGDRKIGAVGVRITHGISSHGIAFNINTSLDHYRHIIPCGTPDKEVTSLQKELQLVGRSSSLYASDSSSSSHRSSHAHLICHSLQQQQIVHNQGINMTTAEQHLVEAFGNVFKFGISEQLTENQLLSSLH